jgi:hypothetical protein
MNEEINIEETLWNYIDGNMKTEDISFVEQLLQSNTEWNAKYGELVEVHRLMQNHIELDQPSMRFTQNVMEEISRLYITPATGNYINKNVIRGIGLFFLTTIGGLLIYVFGQIDWSKTNNHSTLDKRQAGGVDWSKFYNDSYMNMFIMVNIILALMLLDMYITNRKRKQGSLTL